MDNISNIFHPFEYDIINIRTNVITNGAIFIITDEVIIPGTRSVNIVVANILFFISLDIFY